MIVVCNKEEEDRFSPNAVDCLELTGVCFPAFGGMSTEPEKAFTRDVDKRYVC